MNNDIPSVRQVQEALKRLTLRQIDTLSALSGVPAPTIAKIRYGVSENPGIETIRKFMPHIAKASAPDAA